jgi:peroxiredoxin
LADFQEHLDRLDDLGVSVAALSVDPEEDARSVVEDIGIDYPVLYGLDCELEADKIGAYYDNEGLFFHATGFLLKAGEVRQATYSSGPIGRLDAEDVAGVVEFYQNQD